MTVKSILAYLCYHLNLGNAKNTNANRNSWQKIRILLMVLIGFLILQRGAYTTAEHGIIPRKSRENRFEKNRNHIISEISAAPTTSASPLSSARKNLIAKKEEDM